MGTFPILLILQHCREKNTLSPLSSIILAFLPATLVSLKEYNLITFVNLKTQKIPLIAMLNQLLAMLMVSNQMLGQIIRRWHLLDYIVGWPTGISLCDKIWWKRCCKAREKSDHWNIKTWRWRFCAARVKVDLPSKIQPVSLFGLTLLWQNMNFNSWF